MKHLQLSMLISNQRSILLGLLCFSLFVASCKKDDANAPGNSREVVWKEIAKISAATRFSRIDTLTVNKNIDNGVLTLAKLRERFTPLGSGVPISETEYNEDTYLAHSGGIECFFNKTFTFWGLKSRGYPSIYTIGCLNSGACGQHLSYEGADPVATYTFTSTVISGDCSGATGYGNLEEYIFGFHRNWTVETRVGPIAATVWRATIKLKRVGN